MKATRIYIIAALLIAGISLANATPALAEPMPATLRQVPPPPPPDPLHLFKRHPRPVRHPRHRIHIRAPHIKLPPPPPHP